jgi:hypothetical protein
MYADLGSPKVYLDAIHFPVAYVLSVASPDSHLGVA